MKIYLTFIFLIASMFRGFSFSVHDQRHPLQTDSNKIFKRYRSTLNNAKIGGLSETLILNLNHSYDYKIKIGMIQKRHQGTWNIIDGHLVLNDNDTVKLISISEFSNKALPSKQHRFEISGVNDEEIGYRLIIVFNNHKRTLLDSSAREVDIKGRKIKFFNISSVVSIASYTPKKYSNSFKIIINSDKTFFKTNWKINNQRLYSVSENVTGTYFIEEF